MAQGTFDDGPFFLSYRHEYTEFCDKKGLHYLSLEAHHAWAADLDGRKDIAEGQKGARLSVAEILINRVKDLNVDFKGHPFKG